MASKKSADSCELRKESATDFFYRRIKFLNNFLKIIIIIMQNEWFPYL